MLLRGPGAPTSLPRAGRAGGGRALAPSLLLAVLLVAGVVEVRPATAVDATTLAGARDGGTRDTGTAGTAEVTTASGADDLVLRRAGTQTIALGQAVEDLVEPWRATGASPTGCQELAWHDAGATAAHAGAGAGDRPGSGARSRDDGLRLRAWALGGRVVAVRIEAPSTPGLLLPTAVRTGWSLDAVLAGSDGLLVPTTVRGPAGQAATVLTGRLPVGAWPPEGPAPGASGRVVAGEPPPAAVDLLLGDAGTGQVVSAEVRVPVAHGCPGEG